MLIDHTEDIILYFQSFQMVRAFGECERDFLHIKNPFIRKICGEVTPDPIRLTSIYGQIQLDLKFESRVGNDPGFKIQLETGKYQPHLTPTVLTLRYYVSSSKYKYYILKS